MRVFGEGEVIRDPDGRLRFRAQHGTFGVEFGDGAVETTTSTSLTELPTPRYMTDAEAWETFDQAARGYLKISGVEFLRKWDAGKYLDPDTQEGVMSVAMLIPLVRSRVQAP
jgi:hypothetical protein